MSLSNLGLDAFFEIYKKKTVLEASNTLGLTPTAVTQRIKALEKELNTSLFIRTKKGMLLTESGNKLLQYVQNREALENQVIASISEESISNPIRVKFSASTFYSYSKLLPLLEKLRTTHPNLFFDFDVNDSDDKLLKLKENKTDFIIIPRQMVPLELDSKLLKKKRYVLVGGSEHKKNLSDLTIIDYSKLDPFTDMFFKKLKIKYNPSKDRHYINNTLMIPRLIESNIGVAVLDEDHFKQAKKDHTIFNLYPKKYYEIEWAIAWMPRLEMPEYLKKIVELF